MKPDTLVVFPSPLGWMALIAAGATVRRLTFGYPTAAAAKKAALKDWGDHNVPEVDRPLRELVGRLQAYATGTADDFRDIRVETNHWSPFQRQVLAQCRRIRYGATVSYAELAARAGHVGAARAVGNCMAGNRIPLIVPCHRVVRSDGRLGSYSALGGLKTKHRLLMLERFHLECGGCHGHARVAM